jgi:hypothetical protein
MKERVPKNSRNSNEQATPYLTKKRSNPRSDRYQLHSTGHRDEQPRSREGRSTERTSSRWPTWKEDDVARRDKHGRKKNKAEVTHSPYRAMGRVIGTINFRLDHKLSVAVTAPTVFLSLVSSIYLSL